MSQTPTTTSPIPPPRPTLLFANSNPVADNANVEVTLSSSSSMPASPSTVAAAAAAAAREADGFLPEMPQWKKDLIQRRKTNNARTATSASATTATTTTTSATFTPRTSPASNAAAGISSPSSGGGSTGTSSSSSSDQTMLNVCRSANAESITITTTTTATTTRTSHNQKHVKTYLNQTPTTLTSPAKEKSENSLIGGYYAPQVVQVGLTKNHDIKEEKLKDFSAVLRPNAIATSAALATTPTAQTAAVSCAVPIPKQRSVLYSPIQLQQCLALAPTTAATTAAAAAAAKTMEEPELVVRSKKYNNSTTTITKEEEDDDEDEETCEEKYEANVHDVRVTSAKTLREQNSPLSVGNGCGEVETGTATTPTGALTTKVTQSHTKCETEQWGKLVLTAATASSHIEIKQPEHTLQKNLFIRNQQQQQLSQNFMKHGKYRQDKDKLDVSNNYFVQKLQTAIKITENINSNVSTNCSTNSSNGKMVAMQEMKKTSPQNGGHHHHGHGHQGVKRLQTQTGVGGTASSSQASPADTQLDTAEDLSFGPGIVSKLRCRYQTLALRESMEEQHKRRLCRSTSLNTLLDREDNDVIEVRGDEPDVSAVELRKQQLQQTHQTQQKQVDPPTSSSVYAKKPTPFGGAVSRYSSGSMANANANASSANVNGTVAGQRHSMSQSTNSGGAEYGNGTRSRHLKRGNEIMKRARSVEALLSEKSHWSTGTCAPSHASYMHNTTSTIGGSNAAGHVGGAYMPTCVTIEDKIINARERLHSGTDAMPPKRLTSIIDDTERPPPDLVKQTLKKFEASANRRPRAAQRSNGTGDVANKVANYKSIIQEQKPAVVFPKAASGSPTKKLSSSLPPPIAPKVTASINNTPLLRKPNGNEVEGVVFASTPKPILARSTSDYCTPPVRGTTALGGNKQSLLNEKAEGATFDLMISPMTALTKMFDSLNLGMLNAPNAVLATNNKNSNSNDTKQQQLNDNRNSNEPTNTFKSVVGGSHTATDLVIGENDEHETTIAGADDENDGDSDDGNGNGDGVDVNDDKNDKGANDEIVAAAQHNTADAAGMTADGDDNVREDDDDDGGDDNDNNDKPSVTALPMSTSTPTPPSPPHDSMQATGGTSREFGAAKRITKSALENIAKAGTTQEFKFIQQSNASTANAIATTTTKLSNGCETNNVNIVPPAIVNNSTAGSSAGAQSAAISPTTILQATTQSPITKQIGVIRPLINTTTAAAAAVTIGTPALTSREIEKNRINEMKKTKAYAAESAASTSSSSNISNNGSLSAGDGDATNFGSGDGGGINELDATAAATGSPIWALRKRRQGAASGVGPPTTDNSMVFNFSKSTKEVPDYIESDVVIFRRKRELPKPNESGFVLLGDLSVETSTDPECDDFSMCPPSPCDVEFENANVVIDGKSSIRQRQKETSFRVQFNDTLTSTFEYPSEASLTIDESSYIVDNYTPLQTTMRVLEHLGLDDEHQVRHSHKHHHVAVDEIIQLPTTTTTTTAATIANTTATAANATATNILGNLPLDVI